MTRIDNPAAWGAAVWCVLFALPSLYWGLGGEYGLNTIAADPEAVLGTLANPAFVLFTGVLKLAGAVVALTYILYRLPVSRRIRVGGGYALAAGLVAYGLLNMLDRLLMLTGVRETPEALGEAAVRWHLVLWDPVWLLGGVLFGLAVRRYQQATTA